MTRGVGLNRNGNIVIFTPEDNDFWFLVARFGRPNERDPQLRYLIARNVFFEYALPYNIALDDHLGIVLGDDNEMENES